MEDIEYFKKTITDILAYIHFPQNEIATYAQTLLEHVLTDTILDFADTLDPQERKNIEHIVKSHKSQSTFAELFSLMEEHNYENLLRSNMKERMSGMVASVSANLEETEKAAVNRMLAEYLLSFAN